jgi:hypothetical protein
MGRPRKRRCDKTTLNGGAELLDSAPQDGQPLPHINESFPIDPYIEDASLLFEAGQWSTASNDGGNRAFSRTTDHDHGLWNPGAGDLHSPLAFETEFYLQPPGMPGSIRLHNDIEGNSAPLPATATSCSCLATMYLAMSSLQELPSEVGAALIAVRAAASTAQAVLRCEKCGHGSATSVKPAIEAFQNTMLLGTLLPIIVNSYKRLLEIVDHEAIMAKTAGYKMIPILSPDISVSGLSELCGESTRPENALMEPDDWRDAVHRIIRDDVYGHEMETPGLRGIISEMEQRQRRGHTKMDVLGSPGMPNVFHQRQCLGERNAPCLQILDVTKASMASLAIA